MFSFLTGQDSNCENFRRREFLQLGGLGALGLNLPFVMQQQAKAAPGKRKDTNVILIWAQGGTSHHDTFDPKPEAPANVRGSYGFVNTAVPGVQFTEIVPRMAKELNRFAVLRGWNPLNGSHGTADAWVMSGRPFNPAVIYPTYGSVVSQQHGFKTALPPFVQLGGNIDHRFGGGVAGYLGMEHNPFEIMADPGAAQFNVRDITPPAGISMDRVSRRKQMLTAIDGLQKKADLQPEAFGALDEHYQAALNMITAPETKRAFDLEKEDPRLRDRYGRNKFGQSLLLGRRMLEAGVRFVTVTDGGWDTHANNFESLKNNLIPRFDQGIPELLIDLEERGMLDNTLVVWLTDFGRTPKINSASGRDHWSTAGFAIMAGAGVPGGAVLGVTDDEGGRPIKDEYLSADIAATIYEKVGIEHDMMLTNPLDGRPMTLNEGRVIKEWM
ncbi:MAG: hypothetical protein JWN70_3277 [Planctomycetaceae bacterium]|nr:hypothetical protein [Planctomycetaceae bacterium]